MRTLRLAKRESALLIALADIGGVWDVVETTEALTRFADAAVGEALAFLLRQNALSGRLALDLDAPDLQAGCGLVVLALGKLGARELNYSSDIDLIVLYDQAAAAIPDGVEPAPLLVRITKALARLLQERTSDGYVLRVDLRLRPDPASTPVSPLDGQRLRLLRDGRTELGARSADQGSSRGGRSRARTAIPRRSRSLHLAQVFRLCRDRRHPRDEAADPRGAWTRARGRAWTRRQARARRHSRGRVLRPNAAAHLRRPAAKDARLAHARHAQRARRREVGDGGGGEGADRGLSLPAHDRAPAADGRRRTDPAPAVRARRAFPLRPVLRL